MADPSQIRSCAAATLLLAVAASGCGPGSGQEVRARALSAADAGSTSALATDELLTITLDARLSTGFAWQVDEIDPAVLRLDSRELVASAGMGGMDQEILRFAGVAQGRTTLGLAYRRSWEPAGTGEQVYRVEVEVAGRYAGPAFRKAVAAVAVVPAPSLADPSIPTSYDACESGLGPYSGCTPVKDQGACGSCWAFASVGVFENLIYLADPSRSPAPDLSEQYLVSCNDEGWSCKKGGSVALRYFVDEWRWPETEAGAVYEADFPYQGVDLACGSSSHAHHEQATSWASVVSGFSIADPSERVALIQQAILDHGPVWADICVDQAFQDWKGVGVFQGSCPDEVRNPPNHAVVLVGWGDEGGQGYWILRNSWGPGWGDRGYMKIAWEENQLGSTAAYAVYGGSGNRRPRANAGASQLVKAGELVTLDGSASADPDGSIQGYAWVQTAGPKAALSGADTVHPTFTAPAASDGTMMSFRLTVRDDLGAQSSAGTSVVVQAEASSPPPATKASGGGGGGCGSGGGAEGWALLGLLLALPFRTRIRTRS